MDDRLERQNHRLRSFKRSGSLVRAEGRARDGRPIWRRELLGAGVVLRQSQTPIPDLLGVYGETSGVNQWGVRPSALLRDYTRFPNLRTGAIVFRSWLQRNRRDHGRTRRPVLFDLQGRAGKAGTQEGFAVSPVDQRRRALGTGFRTIHPHLGRRTDASANRR